MHIHESLAGSLRDYLGGHLKYYRVEVEKFQCDVGGKEFCWGLKICRKHKWLIGITFHTSNISIGDHRKYVKDMIDHKIRAFEYNDPNLIGVLLADVRERLARSSCKPPKSKVRL